MRILVTGGLGFLGSYIQDALIDGGHQVLNIDNLSGGFKRNANPKAIISITDLCDKEKTQSVIMDFRPEIVFHCAANAREGASFFDPAKIIYANQVAYVNTIESSIKAGSLIKFVFFSSMAVYGAQQPPFNENMKPQPVDVYGISKYSIEEMTRVLAECHGFKYTIIRPHNCYDNQTEVLTQDGFKYFRDLAKEDLIATLNPHINALEYHQAYDWQKIKYSGKLLHFESRSYDLMVTPEHKMWVKSRSRRRSKHRFIIASDLIKSKTGYAEEISSFADVWIGEDKAYYIIPEIKDAKDRSMVNKHQNGHQKVIPMKLWCQFLGWYISEGSRFITKRNYVIVISQYKQNNPQYWQEIVDLVKKMGFIPYITGEKEIRIFSKQLYLALDVLGIAKGCKNKNIPKEIKNLSTEYLVCLYKALMKGDGNIKGNVYVTTSQKLVDDFTEICLKIGKSVTIGKEIRTNPNHSDCYKISITNRNTSQIGDNRTKKVYYKKVDYDDYVYDITVPNHIIFVRRNGKACWSSNCFGPRQSIKDKFRNCAGIFMNRIMRKEPIYIYGDGQQLRQFSYIKDSLPAYIRCIDKADGEIVNIGGLQEITVEELAYRIISEMTEAQIYPITYLPARYGEVKFAYCDPTKSVNLLGYKEEFALEHGIADMAEWAKKLGPQEWIDEKLAIPNHRIPKTWL